MLLPYTSPQSVNVPGANPQNAACLHRLDARSGMPANVSDPLLRLMAGRIGATKPLFYVFAAGRDFSSASFLFLAGISFALVTGKLREKIWTPGRIARSTIWRGAEIFGFALVIPASGVPCFVGVGSKK